MKLVSILCSINCYSSANSKSQSSCSAAGANDDGSHPTVMMAVLLLVVDMGVSDRGGDLHRESCHS